jgi:hypothetical protein
MWNFRKNNLIINDSDNFFVHKVHLERLLHAKPHIQNKGPELPYFMKNKLSIRESIRLKERKRHYENAIIFSRLSEIDNSISNYSKENKPIYCPAFDKRKFTFIKTEKLKNTKKENKNLFARLVKQKSHYPTQRLLNINNYEKHIRKNIKRQRNDNPNIRFATFDQFKQNLVRKYHVNKNHSLDYIKPTDYRKYNYATDIASRNNKINYGFSSIKSYEGINSKNNNIGSLSTMNTNKQGQSLSRCQSAFMLRVKYY